MHVTENITNITAEFSKRFANTAGMIIALAPGRVNLIGDHTDYNAGFVLPMTIDRGVYIALRKRADNQCKIYSVNFQEEIAWDVANLEKTKHCYWANYIKGVMQELVLAGHAISGVEGVIYGDVPVASGLSSSAAVEIATLNALQHLFNLNIKPIDGIKLAQRAENNFIGVQCGIMDQFVSQLGKVDNALFIDCKNLECEDVPINFGDFALLIIDTKVKRELATSAYNERRAACESAVRYFQSINPAVTALRDVSAEMLQNYGAGLDVTVRQRAKHVITENQRVLDAKKYLQQHDIKQFGELLFASHYSLAVDYAVSCKELDFVVDTARHCGAIGARLTGAGFGGCAIALMEKTKTAHFIETLCEGYTRAFALEPVVMQITHNLAAYTIPI